VLHTLPLGEELSRLQIVPSSYSRLCYLLVSSALCSPHASLPRKHLLNICSSYSGTSALRHFVIRTEYRYPHSDSVIGTALRRACGASSIRL